MKRKGRTNSNIFEMLHKDQITQLKEAFNMIDTDSDSIITLNDLKTILNSIGNPFSEEEINQMMINPQITFIHFLSLIAEKISCFDDERTVKNSLLQFAENGRIRFDELKKWLNFDEDDLLKLTRGCLDNGFVDVDKMAMVLKYGELIDSKNEH
ncbi:Myosin regulatory light chain 2 [Dictyocoela muelleri]|nr:Myosin regulatory light chain 2 [Dictyocoela muelleri]